MNTHEDILLLITRAGISEDDLLAFVEDELPPAESADVVRRLAGQPELGSLIFSMRNDRSRLSEELDLIEYEPDTRFVESSVHRAVTGEIDPELAAMIEASGGEARLHRMPRTRVIRHRRLALPAGSVGGLLAACLALGVVAAIWAAWPASNAPGSSPRSATGPSAPSPVAVSDATPGDLPDAARSDRPPAEAAPRALAAAEVEWDAPVTISTPAQALAAARQGRLVIRVYSPDPTIGRGMVESITTTASVSHVAVLDGEIAPEQTAAFADALPVSIGPVFAGDPAETAIPGIRPGERRSWAYMLEVEPTERGFSLLLAGLSREPGTLVELVRTGRPVTTPGDTDDVSWFRGSSRRWAPRIAAPVVVQSPKR